MVGLSFKRWPLTDGISVMEFALNLLWLVLALLSLAFWQRFRGVAFYRQRHWWGGGLLALGCALAVLFPVISVSDDLQTAQAILEDSSPSKRSVRSTGADQAPSNHGKFNHPSFNYRPASSGIAQDGNSAQIFLPLIPSPVAASISPVEGRAPPASQA